MEEMTVSRRRKRRKHHLRHRCARILTLCLMAIIVIGGYLHAPSIKRSNQYEHILWDFSEEDFFPETEFQKTLAAFAEDHDLSLQEWPVELFEMGERNPEAEKFILDYPLKKDIPPEIDLSEYAHCDSVPLLLQWDERWGYSEYSGGLFGLTGCGPTCLSMVSIYLLNDPSYDPQYIAQFSMDHGYSVEGNGSTWTLISEGGQKLGLDVIEIPLDENRIIHNLEMGNPIICVMGPGDFTTTGHFIVLTGYESGKIKVNDPNSRQRSETLWEYDQIQDQIRNLWVCR